MLNGFFQGGEGKLTVHLYVELAKSVSLSFAGLLLVHYFLSPV